MAVELQESYNTGDDSNVSIDQEHWESQTFTAGADYSISSVKLLLYRHATYSPGTVYVTIRATTDPGALPTGGDLAEGTTDGSTLTTDTAGEWREITFDTPYALSTGVEYAIVVVCDNVANFALKWRGKSAGAYADGWRCNSTDGSTWYSSARDNMFETWGEAGIEEGTKEVTVAVVVSLTTETVAITEGTKTVTVAAVVSLATESYKSNQGAVSDRPSDYDGDLYWDEDTGAWSTTRTTHPGNWVQYVLAISEQGDVYFRTV